MSRSKTGRGDPLVARRGINPSPRTADDNCRGDPRGRPEGFQATAHGGGPFRLSGLDPESRKD